MSKFRIHLQRHPFLTFKTQQAAASTPLWALHTGFILRLEPNLAPLLRAKGMVEGGHGANLLSQLLVPWGHPIFSGLAAPQLPLVPRPFCLSPFRTTACLFCRGLLQKYRFGLAEVGEEMFERESSGRQSQGCENGLSGPRNSR